MLLGNDDNPPKDSFRPKPSEPIIYPDPEFERDFFVQQQTAAPFDPSSMFGGQMGLAGGASSPFGASANGVPDIFSLFQGMQGGMPAGSAAGDNPLFSMMAGMQSFGTLGGDGAQQRSQSTSPSATPAAPTSIITKILQSKVHISAIAIITYLLAVTDVAFRTHVFTLFLLWEVVELFFLKAYEKNQTSYLGIVFMVSGIPSEHSTVVMKWLSTIRRILKDVAIFVFFFVVSHLLWQRFAVGQSFATILDNEMVQEFDRLRASAAPMSEATAGIGDQHHHHHQTVDDEFEF